LNDRVARAELLLDVRELATGVLEQQPARDQVHEREEIQEQNRGDDGEGPAVMPHDQPGVRAQEREHPTFNPQVSRRD
jgi:hypothetical protein